VAPGDNGATKPPDIPERIAPASAPGGIVFRQYAQDGALLTESAVTPDMDPIARAAADAQATLDLAGPIALATYDGDTGELIAVLWAE
jgi:hypothetical protein